MENNIARFTAAGPRLLQVSKEICSSRAKVFAGLKRHSLGGSVRAGVKVDMGSNEGLP